MLEVTEIAWDGAVRRRVVDTARRRDAKRWEELAGRVPAQPPPYWAVPGSAVYHVSVDGHVILATEHALEGTLRDLVIAVLTAGTPC